MPNTALNAPTLPCCNPQSLTQRLRQGLRAAGSFLGASLLPQSCALCSLPSGNAPVCAACAADLPRLTGNQCPRCALPLHAVAPDAQ